MLQRYYFFPAGIPVLTCDTMFLLVSLSQVAISNFIIGCQTSSGQVFANMNWLEGRHQTHRGRERREDSALLTTASHKSHPFSILVSLLCDLSELKSILSSVHDWTRAD